MMRSICIALALASQGVSAILNPWNEAHNLKGTADYLSFLIVSHPTARTVEYFPVNASGHIGNSSFLLGTEFELVEPKSVAVNANTKILYVADPGQQKILSYQLVRRGGNLTARDPEVVLANVVTDWIAVDSHGRVFYSQEDPAGIFQVSPKEGEHGNEGVSILTDDFSQQYLNSPGGIVGDGASVIWANQVMSESGDHGPVARAAVGAVHLYDGDGTVHSDRSATAKFAMNVVDNPSAATGLCLSYKNVFYTSNEKELYVARKHDAATAPRQLTDGMTTPRQCVFDGDGTVYIADRAGQIWSMAANLNTLQEHVEIRREKDFLQDPFGIGFVALAEGSASAVSMVGVVFITVLGYFMSAH